MKGWTALHSAAFLNLKEIVQLLLAKKADVNIKDDDGKTPLTIATENGHKEVADQLRKVGAKE